MNDTKNKFATLIQVKQCFLNNVTDEDKHGNQNYIVRFLKKPDGKQP